MITELNCQMFAEKKKNCLSGDVQQDPLSSGYHYHACVVRYDVTNTYVLVTI